MEWKMRYVLVEFKDGRKRQVFSYYTENDHDALTKAKQDYGMLSSRIVLDMEVNEENEK